jgi:hypothetical protein
MRLIPEHQPSFTRHLDDSVAALPAVAVDAARRAVLGTSAVMFDTAGHSLLRGDHGSLATSPRRTRPCVRPVTSFPSCVAPPRARQVYRQHLSVLHAIDHAERFEVRLRARPTGFSPSDVPEIQRAMTDLGHALVDAAQWCAVVARSRYR